MTTENTNSLPVEDRESQDDVVCHPPYLIINDTNREKILQRYHVLESLDQLMDMFDPIASQATGQTIWNLLRSVHRELRAHTFSGDLHQLDRNFVNTFISCIAEGRTIPIDCFPCSCVEPFWVPRTVIDTMIKVKREQHEAEERRQNEEIKSLREIVTSLQRELTEFKRIAMTVPDVEHGIVVCDVPGKMNPNGYVAPCNGWIFIRANGNKADHVIVSVNDKEVGRFNNWTDTHVHTPFTWQLHEGDRIKVNGGCYHLVMFFPCLH